MKRVWESARNNEKHKTEVAELIKLTKIIEAAGATIIEVDFPGADDIVSPDSWD